MNAALDGVTNTALDGVMNTALDGVMKVVLDGMMKAALDGMTNSALIGVPAGYVGVTAPVQDVGEGVDSDRGSVMITPPFVFLSPIPSMPLSPLPPILADS